MEKAPETNVESKIEREKGLAVVVVKPDAFHERDLIVSRLEKAGLKIVRRVEKKLTPDFLREEMYVGLTEDINDATGEHFSSGPCEIILVDGGPDVIDKLVEVTGEKTDPAKCEPKTIRHDFGDHKAKKTSAGNPYSLNAIHRAKNEEERISDLDKFRQYLN